MPLYNVTITQETTMVVVADDEQHAAYVAIDHAHQAFEESDDQPHAHVTGEITAEANLRNGWKVIDVPYGEHGDTRIGELLQVVGDRKATEREGTGRDWSHVIPSPRTGEEIGPDDDREAAETWNRGWNACVETVRFNLSKIPAKDGSNGGAA